MANENELFIPPDPQNKTLRPLNKGMFRDIPSNILSEGALWTAQNALIKRGGVQRRGGYSVWMGDNAVNANDQPIICLAPLWKTTGTQVGILLTSRYLYQATAYAAPTAYYYTYTVASSHCSVTTATVTSKEEGYQEWGFSAAKTTASASGLANDATTYTASISVDGTPNPISIVGSASQTLGDVVTEIDADLTGAVASWEAVGNGYIRITSDLTGSTSTIAITDTDLFGSLTDANVAAETAVAGSEDPLWNTAASEIYSANTGAQGHGDYFVLDADGSGDGPEIIEISSITSDTQLILASSPTGTYADGTDWAIYKRFHVERETLLDWTVADNKLIITDFKRPPYSFDGATFTEYDAGITYICGCLCHMSSRLWIANIIEAGAYYRQRVRWSSATDRTSFNAADYYDIPYTSGKIVRLVPMGDLLVAYFDDAIYLGRPTNYTDLPKAFYQLETAGVGLIGPRAVTTFFNGHMFVGQDDIYFIDARGIQSIGSPVVSETIIKCSNPTKIYAAFDPDNERVAFGFPETGDQIQKIWSYNYKVKAWSYDEYSCTSLSNPLMDLDLTYSDLTTAPGVLDADTYTGWGAKFATYGDTRADASLRDLFVTSSGYVYKMTENATSDDGTPISVIIETGDLDLGFPDFDKTATRLSIRLSSRPSADTQFTLQGSVDGGYTWKALGSMIIETTEMEGRLDFALTGAVLRFRISSSTNVQPWLLGDLVIRVQSRGMQYELT